MKSVAYKMYTLIDDLIKDEINEKYPSFIEFSKGLLVETL